MRAKHTKNKFSAASVFVLMVGDEGAVLVQIQKGTIIRRLFAQSPDPVHVKGIHEALENAPHSPITILFDVMDQSYVRQTLPPVSSFSVGKIINRRLSKDFSPDDIKGYLILDREKTGRKDWNYMMVSLANSSTLQKWILFITERPNPLKGMGLFPLEAQNFMKALEKFFLKGRDKDTPRFEWQVLVSHNKVGGFRQIVMRAGRLVFTRMAQPFGDSTPDVIAGNIEQEMINTLEYLKRLGLQDSSSLSISIICSDEIKRALDPRNIKAGEHHFLTPYEVASMLSLKDAAQPEDHFGDVVVSAFIAKQRRLILPLYTPYTKKLGLLFLLTKQAKISGALGAACLVLWIGMSVFSIFSTRQDIESLESKHRKLAEDLNKIKARSTMLPKSINLYSDIMTITQLFTKKQFDPLPFVGNLMSAFQNAGLAKTLHWSTSGEQNVTKSSDKREIKAEVELNLTFPHQIRAQLVDGIHQLMDRMKAGFPAYTINYPDAPGITSDNADIKTVIGDTENTAEKASGGQSDILKIEMSGPLDKPK